MCIKCIQFKDEAKSVPDYVIYATECELHKHNILCKEKNGYKYYECHTCGVVYHESGIDILWELNSKEMQKLRN